MDLTEEQRAAVESEGKTIVSASAGSGKTFVMIQKLAAAIESGVDLDEVLAVTFTKKAAAQMKEKLRSALIERMERADAETRAKLKIQLSKIPSASISTIHSFCAKLIRTYFYEAGVDGSFDIISADDGLAEEYKNDVLDRLFERYYAEDNEDFKLLLSCYRKKRSDKYLKNLLLSSYAKLRLDADYKNSVGATEKLYTEQGFQNLVSEYRKNADGKYAYLMEAVNEFAKGFKCPNAAYEKILGEMLSALQNMIGADIFAPQLPLTLTRKPADKTEEEKLAGEKFKEFKDSLSAKYKAVRGDLSDRESERERFFGSGKVALAFIRTLMDFDAEYAAVKNDENKLDYEDLEHLTLKLLENEEIQGEINSKYKCVFVDEYQDVNPVQEEIISRIGGENVFLVGDVKQAIYGFRGSKSLFFAEKYDVFEGGGGNALKLSDNFRSCDGVLNFVNRAFSGIMTEKSCGIDYAESGVMKVGGGYPAGCGKTEIHIFGKEENEREELKVYSVKSDGGEAKNSREGLAVLEIVKRELREKRFDLKSGGYVDTQAGDICILTRKRNKASEEIVRALTDAGYSVSGAQEADITSRPEVKQMLDILSYIDDSCQDIPLATALLSPLGGLTCDELAQIRITASGDKSPFRDCCGKYAENMRTPVAEKLNSFYEKISSLRDLSEILDAAGMIDKIMEDTGLEAAYSADGGKKLKNIRRLAADGAGQSVSAFLAKFKEGYAVSSPAAASSDSIKLMTMHASKGLEFPVVIIADVCAAYRGRDAKELLYDPAYGFAPKYFDDKNMLAHTTLLRRLLGDRQKREELKNELNLFYVACTRAMCDLHIMAEEIKPFNPLSAGDATCYADLFDVSDYSPEIMPSFADVKKAETRTIIRNPDAELKERIERRFMREYARADSVNLPVKSSASAILRLTDEEPYYRPYELFGGEEETGAERGTAYHRFLELCDFSVKDEAGIGKELEELAARGLISEGQCGLLDLRSLSEILNMPVFGGLNGKIFREREFLCRLPANEILDTSADDGVLVQGAIDLLCETAEGYTIVDYKYSHKTDAQLKETYVRQLDLYKKAVSVITHTDESAVKTVIVNIFSKRQIDL